MSHPNAWRNNNDILTLERRRLNNNDVIIASCVRCETDLKTDTVSVSAEALIKPM